MEKFTNEQIIHILKNAKLNYAIYMATTKTDEVRYGMCKFILNEIRKIADEKNEENLRSYAVIQKYIPEFNWKTLNGDDRLYWWSMNNFKIRFDKFDDLIELYKQK